MEIRIWSWDYTTLFTNTTVNVGSSAYLFSADNITSLNGLHIQFSSLGNVAIDDIVVSTTPVLIPEPSSALLAMGGLGLLVAFAHRRRKRTD